MGKLTAALLNFLRHTVVYMQTVATLFLATAMFTMGIESSVDKANDGHPIDQTGAHHSEVMHESSPNPGADSEPDREYCEHCCHGHSFSVTVRSFAASFTFSHLAMNNRDRHMFIAQPQAPLTPPPKTRV